MSFALTATKRTEAAPAVRAAGNIPAVVYGPHMETISIALPYGPFEKIYRDATESTFIEVAIEGDETRTVLIQDMQFDPVKGSIVHVDFRNVTMGEELSATVSLEFVGVAPAVKELGGTLITSMEAINVTALPKDLVDQIEVDLSVLKTFDDAIRVKDIALPTGVTVTDDAEQLVAKVNAPLSEEQLQAMEETSTASVDDIEVEAKGKDDAEEGSAEEKKEEAK
jgi:large subunit ribosomal protein L25